MAETNGGEASRLKQYYYRLSLLAYCVGVPNYYYEEFKFPKFILKFQEIMFVITEISNYTLVLMVVTSYATQHNLTPKQSSDQFLFALSFPIVYAFVPILANRKEKLRYILYNLTIKLKHVYNDIDVETHTLKKARSISILYLVFLVLALILYGVYATYEVFYADGTFVTLITVWPDVNDRSREAGIARVVLYLVLWMFCFKIASAYILIVSMIIFLGGQYKNLTSYFRSLDGIFKQPISQKEKESKYEHAFRVGIRMHSKTIRCTRLTSELCNVVFSGQVIVNLSGLIILMLQFMHTGRDLTGMISVIFTACCLLTGTGCFMWSSGDVTYEASALSTAMFESGWQHCQGECARRIRPMLVIAMWQSQVPVELKCLGILRLSYRSYLRIVRASYSAFSLMY